MICGDGILFRLRYPCGPSFIVRMTGFSGCGAFASLRSGERAQGQRLSDDYEAALEPDDRPLGCGVCRACFFVSFKRRLILSTIVEQS